MDYPYFDYFSHRLARLAENIRKLELSLEENEQDKLDKNEEYVEGIKNKQGGLTESERVAVDFFEDDVALYDEARQFYRQSSFLMLFAFLEDSLLKICALIKARYNYNLESSDLHGSGVVQAKKYIQKVAQIDIDANVWERLDAYRIVRNHLAHEYGELDQESKKKIMKLSKMMTT